MPKEPKVSHTGLLEIRLGSCLSGPTKGMAADLHHAARQCNRVANAMTEHWLIWHRQNPDYVPQPRTARGEPKVNKDGEPVLEDAWLPQCLDKEMYALGSTIAPDLGGMVIGQIHKAVKDRLAAKMPWNHEGKAKRRHEAVLTHEVNIDSYRSLMIPFHNATLRLCYSGIYNDKVSPRSALGKQILLHGRHQAVLSFQLWSAGSCRANTNVICRIEARQLTPGNRRVLQRVAAGEWKLCDSKLVWKEGKGRKPSSYAEQRAIDRYGGYWSFQMTYQQPSEKTDAPKDRVAVLQPADPDTEQPFVIESPEGRVWKLGDSRVLTSECHRLETRRIALRKRYRDAGSAKRGHGRGRIERDIRPVTRQLRDLSSRFVKNLVAEVERFLTRYDCGALRYEEPTLWARQRDWFAQRKLPFDWTLFQSLLGQRCGLLGVEMVKERVKREQKGAAVNPGERSQVGSGAGKGSFGGQPEVIGVNGTGRNGTARKRG